MWQEWIRFLNFCATVIGWCFLVIIASSLVLKTFATVVATLIPTETITEKKGKDGDSLKLL